MPTILVSMNAPGPSIERSTWLSAARCMIDVDVARRRSMSSTAALVADIGLDEAIVRARSRSAAAMARLPA